VAGVALPCPCSVERAHTSARSTATKTDARGMRVLYTVDRLV